MIWGHLTIALGVFCLLLLVFLVQSRGALNAAKLRNRNYSSIQKSFKQAVAGAEATLEHEKGNSARLLRILDSIHDGVAMMDEKGNLGYANPSLWRLYNIEPEQQKTYMGRSWLGLHSPKGQDEIKNIVLPAVEVKSMWLGESDVLTNDGSLIRAELFISKVDGGYIGFIRDVTERYRANLDRERLSLQLHQMQKSDAVERVVRALVHEFNNGLSSVNGFAEMLMEDVGARAKDREYAKKIYFAGQQMVGLLEQARMLVPAEKVTGGQRCDLVSLVPSAIGELKKRASRNFDIVDEIHLERAEISCDGMRIHQLLTHVLQNALDSIGPEAGEVYLNLDIHHPGVDRFESTGDDIRHEVTKIDRRHSRLEYGYYNSDIDYVQLTVLDRGSGIAPDVMQHILDPFFSTRKIGGRNGLGMSIVKSVLRYNRGYLKIDSTLDKGTTLTMLLPTIGFSLIDGFHSTKSIILQLSQEVTAIPQETAASYRKI